MHHCKDHSIIHRADETKYCTQDQLSGVFACDRNLVSTAVPKDAAINAEANDDLEVKLAAANAEIKRLHHIEGESLEQLCLSRPNRL